jgi:demethylmenaquinone methyltransferase/2-methoxy-6-polyprenyl-1,4-benzoquinol methylase
MYRLPFADATFDWVWSADCAGYPAGEILSVLKELARVTVPGGTVAILGWSSQQVLPGYPLLEARLNANCSTYAPYLATVAPEAHFLRAASWFRQAGLQGVAVQTFVHDAQAPLDAGLRRALASLFKMLWEQPPAGVWEQDWRSYERLCRPESPDCILDLSAYHAFFTYTMFRARVGTALP